MYSRFSELYDLLTFDIDYQKYASNILGFIEKENISKPNMLEIGCGTGNLTQELAKEGYSILAFDNSMDMLNVAFPKLIDLENVNVVMQDMYKFAYLNYEFDVIISLLDVINYILDPDKIEKLFKNIYSGLREGGLFIFDINSEDKLLNVLGNNTYIYERENVFYTWENTLDDDLVYFDLNFFVKEDGLYERFKETQVERYYSIEFIKSLLEKVGFVQIEFIDEDTAMPVNEKTQRILFKAKK
ncbi:MAG: class I SAM-dependent methyltransferase [Tissierellia bacterium]|nr:class I SAM-dependent methyltransferase [Tissierellia bacterium]